MDECSPFRRLDAYMGPLTPAQAAAGIEAAIHNARALLQDAGILLERERWPRGASLSILAIEEEGKVPLIRGLLTAKTPKELRDEWRAYRCHTKKNVMWALRKYASSDPNIGDFRPMYASGNDDPRVLDAVKQIGFYSDCLGKALWSIPDDVVGEPLARLLFDTAKLLVRAGDSPMTTEPELQLWVKHLKPVRRRYMLLVKQALIACYQEASELGVLNGNQSVDDIVRFLL